MTLRTLDYLTSPELSQLYWPGVLTGLLIALMCAGLSVLVVLKRLAFIGQGVSHAAFGGVGLAAVAGLLGSFTMAASIGQFLFVLAACLGAAMLMAWISRRGDTESDTAIGIVLVGSMAAGAVLIRMSPDPVQWESFLFGDMLAVGWNDFLLAGAVTTVVLGMMWWFRRPLLFWAFDESAATAWGVKSGGMHFLLMLVLALVTVTAMKLAGVVLATAMLVLPGATALKLARTWGGAYALAMVVAVLGVMLGVVLSFEADWPPGPSIVLVLTAGFGIAWAAQRLGLSPALARQ
ncbi:MAG: metal ABC transporter permease [Phycisphaerales bacterium]